MARPSKYKQEFADQAYKLCLLGAKDEELADFFEVSESTLNLWKLRHKAFSEALKSGKDDADSVVAQSLFHRATGYSHEEDKIFLHEGKPVVVPTRKHYPPDTTAAIFWLKNRQKGKWRDVHSNEVSGPDGGPVKISDTEAVAKIGSLLEAAARRKSEEE